MIENNVIARLKRGDKVLAFSNGTSRFIGRDDFASWFKELEDFPINRPVEKPRIIHFLYESGAFVLGTKARDLDFYVVDTEFESNDFATNSNKSLKLSNRTGPSLEDYTKSFESIQKHLFAGNAYQVNLTFPFDYDVEPSCSVESTYSFMHSSNAGDFAQTMYWPNKNLSFISNSPETLFEARLTRDGNWRVVSKPIKGTAASNEWDKLVNSKKDQAELLMITDLVRNDLNKLSDGRAIVDALKARLDVLGLVHQYSEVSAIVDEKTSIAKIVTSLFPGGSITGAPKKRVSEIISEVEKEPRRFYCGSTLFWDGGGLSASINIRSGTIEWNTHKAKLHAGGGITVLSDVNSEWQEMLSKLNSLEMVLNQSVP